MKIAVLCASRNNADDLRTIIGALRMLESGKNEIEYCIGADEDDKKTHEEFILLDYSPRKKSLGEVWNSIAKYHIADAYALVTDRALCVTPFWDTFIEDAYKKDDTKPVWWQTNAGPVIPIVPRKWIEVSGQLFTNYFPFWFDDTWLHELSAMVFGLPNHMIGASCFIVKKDLTTKRMRDLRFWMDFFLATRPERERHAAQIRKKLGLPAPDMEPIKKWFKANEEMWTQNWYDWEQKMGDRSEPDALYFEAKKYAEDHLKNVSSI